MALHCLVRPGCSGRTIVSLLLCLGLVTGCAITSEDLSGGPSTAESGDKGAGTVTDQSFERDERSHRLFADLPEEGDVAPRSRLVASDFADALSQVPGLGPEQSNLRVTPPQSRFAELIVEELHGAGYDLSLVPDSMEAVLHYQVSVPDAAVDTYTVIVSVDSVQLRRSYRADSSGVQPVTPMYVRGASSAGIVLDATRFDEPAVQRAMAAADESASGQ